ncbi:MAG: 50S ribosomal protein L15 [Saprospiraceae bacterium]|nr:50S ribosomal protein L15 [Saprospiraceae bacterium]
MELHELKPAKGSVKNRKRIARGEGSGKGGTATRGHKGAKSRSGYKRKRNFEGGQMPLQMRLPKRGFNTPNKKQDPVVLNIGQLQSLSEKYGLKEISLDWLKERRIIRKTDVLKILGKGTVSASLKIEAHAASESATKAIEAAGGAIQIVQ